MKIYRLRSAVIPRKTNQQKSANSVRFVPFSLSLLVSLHLKEMQEAMSKGKQNSRESTTMNRHQQNMASAPPLQSSPLTLRMRGVCASYFPFWLWYIPPGRAMCKRASENQKRGGSLGERCLRARELLEFVVAVLGIIDIPLGPCGLHN